ncbi:hypothetical protein L596_022511 [Steinernema carpocapsae]|uniref:Uncharacterized protein n=1 Tax=Steinernema carpocapsae TaxID=34508 RepID=A0A4U5MLZ0_STECR|nr:hypothetical protein L596_022511 [Steinernema carpocapsae]
MILDICLSLSRSPEPRLSCCFIALPPPRDCGLLCATKVNWGERTRITKAGRSKVGSCIWKRRILNGNWFLNTLQRGGSVGKTTRICVIERRHLITHSEELSLSGLLLLIP